MALPEKNNRPIEELLTVNQVSSMLKVHPQSVYRWIRRGEIPAYKVGRHSIRLKTQDIQKHLRSATDRTVDIKKWAAEMVEDSPGIRHNAIGNGQSPRTEGG